MSATITHELIGVLIIGALAIAALASAEILKRFTNLPTELTRKSAHIGSGFAVLLIPQFVDSSLTVLILAVGFALLMFVTYATGTLPAVHGVGRGVGGVLWYPITAWLTFFVVFDIREGTYLQYAIPILVLACADAMGAVVGKRWGHHKYEVYNNHCRSVEGSSAFFLVAYFVIAMPLIMAGGVAVGHALVVGFAVALLATAFEAISVHGLDNLLVPLGTLLFLDRFLELSSTEVLLQLVPLVGVGIIGTALAARRPNTGGGFVTFVLAAYTVAVLGGLQWLPALGGLLLVFAVYERLTPVSDELRRSRYDMGTVVIGLTVPTLLVLLHAAFVNDASREALFIAYIASIGCQAAILIMMLPQHRSFRLPRLRRLVTAKDPWQFRPTLGKILLAVIGVAIFILAPLVGILATDQLTVSLLLAAIVAGTGGTVIFFVLAATNSCRRACRVCGNVTLYGLGCCHDLHIPPPNPPSMATLTFRKTYLLANTSAAALAVGVVLWTPW